MPVPIDRGDSIISGTSTHASMPRLTVRPPPLPLCLTCPHSPGCLSAARAQCLRYNDTRGSRTHARMRPRRTVPCPQSSAVMVRLADAARPDAVTLHEEVATHVSQVEPRGQRDVLERRPATGSTLAGGHPESFAFPAGRSCPLVGGGTAASRHKCQCCTIAAQSVTMGLQMSGRNQCSKKC